MADSTVDAPDPPRDSQERGPGTSRWTARGMLRTVRDVLRDYNIVVATVLLFIVLGISSDAFLSQDNLLNILDQNAPLAIVAFGTTLVIVGGGFDLSSGATFALAGVLAAWLANNVAPGVGLVGGVVAGAIIGLINGALVTQLRINSFLATLASALALRGLAVAITGGFIITVTSSAFIDFGGGSVGEVSNRIIYMLGVLVVLQLVLSKTRFGRYIYAVGGNAEAARLSGVRVNLIRAGTFVVGGACAGIAGVMHVSQIATAQADFAVGLELDAIAAAVLGGASIMGGIGTVWRTAFGVLLLALITNGFNILGIEPYFQDIAKAAIILVAISVNSLSGRR